MNYKLRSYQQDAVTFLDKTSLALFAIKPGLGKTLIALDFILKKRLTALIVVPAYLKKNWEKEILKFTPEIQSLITIISYSQLGKLKELNADILVLDESHYTKNPSAKRTQNVHQLVSSNPPKFIALLSGTPAKNDASELYSQLKLLSYSGKFKFNTTYTRFRETFCYKETQWFGSKKTVKYHGVRNEDLLKRVMAPVLFTVDESKVLDLPEQVRKKIDLGLPSDLLLDGVDIESDAYATVKKENALGKAQAGLKYIQDLIHDVRKLVIFTDHLSSLEFLKENINGWFISGATPMDQRNMFVEWFNDSDEGVLVCTIGAASVGINLQTANHLLFTDYPHVPGDLEQAEKRVHRVGQTKTCFYHYLISGEIDERILDNLTFKQSNIAKIL